MHTDRRRISQGSEFEREIGYSRAIVDGRWVFVVGTTGFDYATMTIADDVVAQVEQTLRNIDDAVTRAGLCAADVVRVQVPPCGCCRLRGVSAAPCASTSRRRCRRRR